MARITITLQDELDRELRETVAHTIGFKKGNLQLALEEAVEMWIKSKNQPTSNRVREPAIREPKAR